MQQFYGNAKMDTNEATEITALRKSWQKYKNKSIIYAKLISDKNAAKHTNMRQNIINILKYLTAKS